MMVSVKKTSFGVHVGSPLWNTRPNMGTSNGYHSPLTEKWNWYLIHVINRESKVGTLAKYWSIQTHLFQVLVVGTMICFCWLSSTTDKSVLIVPTNFIVLCFTFHGCFPHSNGPLLAPCLGQSLSSLLSPIFFHSLLIFHLIWYIFPKCHVFDRLFTIWC